MSKMPFLVIPDSPHPSKQQGFANREQLLLQMVGDLVSAGNLVNAGKATGRLQSMLVDGYKGVGKSSLIVQALRYIRQEVDGELGQRSALTGDFFERPEGAERWIILYLRGKTSRDIKDATTNAQMTLQGALDMLLNTSEDLIPELARVRPAEMNLISQQFNRAEARTRKLLTEAIEKAIQRLTEARLLQGGGPIPEGIFYQWE